MPATEALAAPANVIARRVETIEVVRIEALLWKTRFGKEPLGNKQIGKRFAVNRDEFGKQPDFDVLKQSFTCKHRNRRRFQSLSLKSPAAACWSSVSDLASFHSVQQTNLRLEFNFIFALEA
jgi:hypothetical protein